LNKIHTESYRFLIIAYFSKFIGVLFIVMGSFISYFKNWPVCSTGEGSSSSWIVWNSQFLTIKSDVYLSPYLLFEFTLYSKSWSLLWQCPSFCTLCLLPQFYSKFVSFLACLNLCIQNVPKFNFNMSY
jgi:hypothetical protein